MATETPRPLAVLDTNSVIAALKSPNPASPNVELLREWKNAEFHLLYCDGLRTEYVEKFAARGVDPSSSKDFLESLDQRGILIALSPSDIVPVIEADPDDDVILACAVRGNATHIVTYDPHFDILGGGYRGIQILRPLDFLYLIRGDVPASP